MKRIKKFTVFLGEEDVRANILKVTGPNPKYNEQILQFIDDKKENQLIVAIGLGSDGRPAVLLLNYSNNFMGMFVGAPPGDMMEWIQDNIPQWSQSNKTHMSREMLKAVIKLGEDRGIYMDDIKDQANKMDGRFQSVYNKSTKAPKPNNDSRELQTIQDTECLTTLLKWVNKDTFLAVSKQILKGVAAMIVVAKPPKENDPDVKYMAICRLGEPVNDPLDAKLLGMIAYQPEVLKNGIMYNPLIEDDLKEHFESEFNDNF